MERFKFIKEYGIMEVQVSRTSSREMAGAIVIPEK
jgi:hypothetical protein